MGNIKYFIISIVLFNLVLFSQEQHKIEWPSLANSAWPIMWGDAQATGRSEYIGPTKANVVVKANLPLGILYGPVIGYNNMLYFGTNSVNTDTNNTGNYFYSYTPNGQPFWVYNTDFFLGNFTSPIVAKDSSIYFNSSDGYLYSMYYKGEVEWRYKVGTRGGFHKSVAKNGDIYIITDKLLVLTSEGNKKFEKEFEEPVSSPVVFSPGGDTLFFHTGTFANPYSSNYVIAADLDGNTLWKYKLSDSNEGLLVVDNKSNIYFFGSDPDFLFDKFVYSITKEGTLRWKYPIRRFTEKSSPTINNNGDIIFSTIDSSYTKNLIICLDYWGNKKWVYEIEQYEGQLIGDIDHGLVCDTDGNIYFGSTSGSYFYAINKDGEFLWKLPLHGNEFDSYPAISSDGTLYIGTQTSEWDQNQEYTLLGIRNEPLSVEKEKPVSFELYQNYPNPFNPTTKIKFAIPLVETPYRASLQTKLIVYDILGREVKTLINKSMQPGEYEVEFNGSNLTSGVYFYVLQTGNNRISKKMLLVK